jgi:hypothetical protein
MRVSPDAIFRPWYSHDIPCLPCLSTHVPFIHFVLCILDTEFNPCNIPFFHFPPLYMPNSPSLFKIYSNPSFCKLLFLKTARRRSSGSLLAFERRDIPRVLLLL